MEQGCQLFQAQFGLYQSFHLGTQLLAVLVGVLMIEFGVWKLTSPFMKGDPRQYDELRHEVDGFIVRVRSLNKAALEARAAGTEESWLRLHEVMGAMHSSVDHMAELAGKAAGDEHQTE